MTAKPDLHPLKVFSNALSGLVAAVAPAFVSLHSHRALTFGFVWKLGLVVTADEGLAEDGEVEVLALLAEGESNRRIAAALAFFVHTAKLHVGPALDKRDATGRTEAVAHATRLGVLEL